MKLGDSVGALVVQSKRCEKLSEQYEALLVTLAAQLAWVVPDVKQLKVVGKNNIRVLGVKGAPGVAVGEVVHAFFLLVRASTNRRMCGYRT